MCDFTIGERVQDMNGFRGTIRYIGPVCTSKEKDLTWIGIEFDDPTRGKHDGSVESEQGHLVRYFNCINGGSGSFLKIAKVSRGVSLVEALASNYVELDAPLLAPNNILVGQFAQTVRGMRKKIELYGEHKIRERQQVSELRTCTLRTASIFKCGDKDSKNYSLLDAAQNIEMLDLKDNLLSDWREVIQIGHHFPRLTMLALSGNRMRTIENDSMTIGGTFKNLKALILQSAGLKSWKQVLIFTKFFPALQELYLSDNDFSDMGTEICGIQDFEGLSRIKLLDLSECNIHSWDQVSKLAKLDGLISLSLNHNPITSIVNIDGSNFPSLESLQIHGTEISSWSDIDKLSHFKSLKSLRFGGCPLSKPLSTGETRLILISRLPNIFKVNASPVSLKERIEAEISYIRMIHREAAVAKQNSVNEEEWNKRVALEHPQYNRLLSLRNVGPKEVSLNTANTLSSNTIEVILEVADASNCSTPFASKKIPSTILIGRLKQLCKRLFGIDTDLQVLYFVEKVNEKDIRITLDDDSRSIAYFSVETGTKIFVERRDACYQSKVAAQAAEDRLTSEMMRRDELEAARTSSFYNIGQQTVTTTR